MYLKGWKNNHDYHEWWNIRKNNFSEKWKLFSPSFGTFLELIDLSRKNLVAQGNSAIPVALIWSLFNVRMKFPKIYNNLVALLSFVNSRGKMSTRTVILNAFSILAFFLVEGVFYIKLDARISLLYGLYYKCNVLKRGARCWNEFFQSISAIYTSSNKNLSALVSIRRDSTGRICTLHNYEYVQEDK